MSIPSTLKPGGSSIQLSGAGGSRQFVDRLMQALMFLAAGIALVPLVWILLSVIVQGFPLLTHIEWWTQDLAGTTDRRGGGGALAAILGTVMIGLITGLIAVPIGVLGAIFLIEYGRGTTFARTVSFMVDILSGVPSIVAALFVYALLITTLGAGRSAFAASFALVLLMLPTVLRSTEEMLKLVPDSLREAAYALGVPKWKTIVKVVIPTAFSGIATGVVLGLARVMGETAPLLILVAYAQNMNLSPLSDTMGTLPTMINRARNVADTLPGYERVWGAALTLIVIVMGLNLLARWIARASRLKER